MSFIRNIVVGVSGGVDSAVAALILKNKGFNVIGVFMKNWDLTDEIGTCTTFDDLEDAKNTCQKLKIPFYEVNFVKEYWNEVFLSFMKEYEVGFTPNPDILCNKYIKFKTFINHAFKNLNADAIATGHYAKTSFGDFLENYKNDVNVKLLKAKDSTKDQTFFLSQISQESLRKTMFPLGSLTKDVVKKIAIENGLEKIAKKPESTGICFVGHRNFKKFMSEYVTPKPGKFININNGEVEGIHDGIHLWTLGQKCRIPGLSEPFYIAKKNVNTGDILIANGLKHAIHYSCMFLTEKPHWIADPPELYYKEKFDFRFQHLKPLTKCDLIEFESGELFGVLERPLRALTPGQFAVFYKGEECLGSAKITNIGPTEFSLGNGIPDSYEEYDQILAPCKASILKMQVLSEPRTKINGKFLSEFNNKPISILGQVLKVHANGSAFDMKSVDDKVITVILDEPLSSNLEGWVEVRGNGQGRNSVICQHITSLNNIVNDSFDIDLYNDVINVINSCNNPWVNSSKN